MAKNTFYIDKNRTEAICFESSIMSNSTIVIMNGIQIGSYETKEVIKNPITIELPNGKILVIKKKKTMYILPTLEYTVDDKVLFNSPTDPEKKAEGIGNFFYILCALNFLPIVLSYIKTPVNNYLIISTVFVSIIYLLIGYFIKVRKSHIALLLGILFLIFDLCLVLYSSIKSNNSNIGFIIFRIWVLLLLIDGYKSIKLINKKIKIDGEILDRDI